MVSFYPAMDQAYDILVTELIRNNNRREGSDNGFTTAAIDER